MSDPRDDERDPGDVEPRPAGGSEPDRSPEPANRPELADDPELAERLTARRPVPAPGFRGALGRRLVAEDPGYGPRPARLRVTVAAYCAGGSLLVALGALEALGIL